MPARSAALRRWSICRCPCVLPAAVLPWRTYMRMLVGCQPPPVVSALSCYERVGGKGRGIQCVTSSPRYSAPISQPPYPSASNHHHCLPPSSAVCHAGAYFAAVTSLPSLISTPCPISGWRSLHLI